MDQNISALMQSISSNLNTSNVFKVEYNQDKNEVSVDFNLADTTFQVFLTARHVTKLYRVIIKIFPGSTKLASVRSTDYELVWNAGIPSVGAEIKSFRGVKVGIEAGKEYKVTGNGVEEAYSYAINSASMYSQIKKIVKQNGYKLKMDIGTKIGLIVAVGTVALLLLMGLLAATGVIHLDSGSTQPNQVDSYSDNLYYQN